MKPGYSIIELLIVLLITSILTLLVVPSYQNYLTPMRHHDGQTALLDLASRMEHYYSEQHTYITATIALGQPSDILSQSLSPGGWYVLSIRRATDTSYLLQATPLHKGEPLLTLDAQGQEKIT